jgi:hypothetical protein
MSMKVGSSLTRLPDYRWFTDVAAGLRVKLVKPGDHPDFYRIAPPAGTSRQSTIVLDRDGKFWHDGGRVDHPALERALRSWIARHPDDGQFILTNGYDWCYFRVDDAPQHVDALRVDGDVVTLVLAGGDEEPLDPSTLMVGDDGVVYAKVKGGAYEARFSRHAQTQLAPLLTQAEPPRVSIAGRDYQLPPRRR